MLQTVSERSEPTSITSRRNPLVARFRDAAERGSNGLMLLDGAHLLSEALDAGVEVTDVAIANGAAERPELLDENGMNGNAVHTHGERWTDARGHSLFPLEFPDILVEDGGSARFRDDEVLKLREYLLKGGFIFASDYWGTRAGEQWAEEIGKVLPGNRYPIIELPPDHPVWHSLIAVKEVPQMASFQFWTRSGGGISERGSDSAVVHVRGIADEHGRLMVVMIHNSDIPDAWEREAEDPQYFYRFSPDAYAVGIDIVLYAMTH